MAYKINGTEVIDDNGDLVNFSAYNLNNDDGQIEIQSNSPMVGTVSGYSSGGFAPSPIEYVSVIEKYPFATDTSASDVGDLTVARLAAGGQSSETHGYVGGGTISGPTTNTIDKFPFAVDTNATDVGNLTVARHIVAGQSSFTHGYASGGSPIQVTIDKFPFSTDTNATDIGDLTQARWGAAGQSSTTYGYSSGGYASVPLPTVNIIDKFSFSVNNNASDVGDLSEGKNSAAGQSSTTHGYASGGQVVSPAPAKLNTIEKFPFASDTNSTDTADLTETKDSPAGTSSINFGYLAGGRPPPNTALNTIEKFSFVTDSNATDVGDLSVQAIRSNSGQQD